jgi:hypothetical protein
MDYATDLYCSTCFAMPGELCRTKYLVHGHGEVTPVICPTHSVRVEASEREAMRHSLAQMLCAAALKSLEQSQGSAALFAGGLSRNAR